MILRIAWMTIDEFAIQYVPRYRSYFYYSVNLTLSLHLIVLFTSMYVYSNTEYAHVNNVAVIIP